MTRARTTSPSIRVVIADDHPVVATGLLAVLRQNPAIEVVGIARSFGEAVQVLQSTPADVLILDLLGMHGSPLVTVAQLRQSYPSLAIVVYSSNETLAPELLRAGVLGYVAKDEVLDHLVRAIESTARRQRYVSPNVEAYLERTSDMQHARRLSPKEQLVLKLLAQGLNTAEIAAQMGIATHTVLNYLTDVRAKTGCVGRTELVDWYRQIYGDTEHL